MSSSSHPDISVDDIERLVRAEHWNPFAILGPHRIERDGTPALAVRAFSPQAAGLTVEPEVPALPQARMTCIHRAGLYEAVYLNCPKPFPYQLRTKDQGGRVSLTHDPYAYPPALTEYDLHLFGEGRHYRTFDLLGAHLRRRGAVEGIHFTVWAPNALRVSAVGDFNSWDGRRHPMGNRGPSGVWELFVPGLGEGIAYKYEILPRGGGPVFLKADPYAFAAELRPKTASVVCGLDHHAWRDEAWMKARTGGDPLKSPLSIYEVHLGSWMRVPEEGNRWLTYRELAAKLIPYVKDLGFTHLELMPITEYPFDASWGYQTIGYFAPTSRYGRPEDFMAFVDACHQAGLGVILDWTPAHFPDDPHGLAWFDGTHLYDHEDPRLGYHPEWRSRIFNFGRREVSNFLVNSALFWLVKYHIDGLRVDAVASMLYLDYGRQPGEWIPNRFGGHENLEAVEFMKELNVIVHKEHPGVITIAEESTAWPGVSRPTYLGGLGFTLKWNLGWMHDMLEYFSQDPVHRKYHQNHLTFGLLYAFTENFVLVLSHDEVVYGKRALLDKMPGDEWQRFANLRALLGYMYGHPGKKMLFMGGEFGQWWEWNHDSSLQWHLLEHAPHRGPQHYMSDLNGLYRAEPALYQVDFDWPGFRWIDFSDADQSVVAFLRQAKDPNDFIVFVGNFTPVPRSNYQVGVPLPGVYREILNSDAKVYGGSNLGNSGGLQAEAWPCHEMPYSLSLTIPPLGVLWLKLR